MNSTFKTIIYMVLGFMVVSLVARLFFNLLPYMLLIGTILFVYFKIKGYFIQRKRGYSSKSHIKTDDSNKKSQYSTANAQDEDVVSDIIDVDYKDVDYKDVE